jgi:ribosomal-protein-alanine N-acetyltransferase
VGAIVLREARSDDFEPMWRLDQECFVPDVAYSRGELRAFLRRNTAETIVADRDGHIVGFVLGWRGNHATGHVGTLDVAPSARRHGVGRRLLLELERRFRAAHAARMQLEVAVTNTTAITFYEGLGYRKTAHLPGYYGRGLHAWKMGKALDASPVSAGRAAT